ncbi:hypothetical protein D9756_004482 [Leucocoprinus leucothites]|uniref:Nephrocystin 3-like N-terminal domain-containing protein n=1 Tax=Leucocoprinus leucothites TaxID=201217 RepID=A0A8H5G9U3_9AGAR|nr:hypothetical protein D9756_004482 [Leucoagaricus leucothites]
MFVLPGAHDFVINAGPVNYNQSSIDILYEASTPEASVDAEERDYAPRCYEGTREQYIEDITTWATASNEGDSIPPLYWMRGPAGVGKSAVAQTCAECLEESGHLAAAFFFSVNGRRKDHTHFFPTLAHQLSTTLPDYCDIVNHKVSVDRSLVKKTMSSQFRSLIVELLQELRELGKDIQRRAIFIDGLDECQSTSAQMEIIKIITSSIQAGGFENILRRRNLLHLSPSWPTAKQIQVFVDAAAGLFAHPATVLRFIDHHSYPEIEEILEAILNPISKRGCQSTSAYAELDALYTLILQRVPDNILSPMQLLFSYLVLDYDDLDWFLSILCNQVGISDRHFQGIYHHVQAVIQYQEYPLPTFDKTINLGHSFFDHNLSSTPESSLRWTLGRVHGTLAFRHKSFYDFLHDPARSSSFCVTTLAMCQNLFDRLIQQHHHYALSYVIQGTKLVLRPGMASSSASLSWPQGSEFVDSYIKIRTFLDISFLLSYNHSMFHTLMEDLPPSSLQKLAQLDHHKPLLALIMVEGIGVFSGPCVFCLGRAGVTRANEFTIFSRLEDYTEFDPDTFLAVCLSTNSVRGYQLKHQQMVDKLESARVIRPYHPQLGSSRAASVLHTISRQKRSSIKSGLYKLGHGDKSVIWFWEFDTEKQYFHQFGTVNYEEAMAFYKVEKFTMWDDDEDEDSKDEDSSSAEDEDGSNVKEGDGSNVKDEEDGSNLEQRGEPGHPHGDESGHEVDEEQKKEMVDNEDGQNDTKIPSEVGLSAGPAS